MRTTLLFVLFLPAILSGCISSRPFLNQIQASPEALQSASRFKKEYVWVPGDQVEVFVRRVPEVSRVVVVRPDGFITLPLVDDVRAAGLTPAELKESLTTLFAQRLAEPEVSVIAINVPPPVVYVMGEVGNALAVPLRSAPTAIEAITFAGGFRRSAKPEDTSVIRLEGDGFVRAIPVSNTAGGQPGPIIGLQGMVLQPGDIVFVPEGGRSQVTRFLDDLVNRPLSSIASALGVYLNFRLVRIIQN
jgi:polysaccharide export outer membrane protein